MGRWSIYLAAAGSVHPHARRPRCATPSWSPCPSPPCACSEEEGEGHEDFDPQQLREHEEFTKVKNIEKIELGRYEMETWYYSPFPPEYRDCKKLYFCEYDLQVRWGVVGWVGVGVLPLLHSRAVAATAAGAAAAAAACAGWRGLAPACGPPMPARGHSPAPARAACRPAPAVLQAAPPDAAPPAQGQAAAPAGHRDLPQRKHLHV